MNLKNKVVAITGGASGLGEATLRNFVANGAKVAILDLNVDNANKLVDELGSSPSGDHFSDKGILEEAPGIRSNADKSSESGQRWFFAVVDPPRWL